MADFQIEIIDGGTLYLPEGTRLTYAEEAIAFHLTQGLIYKITQNDERFGVYVPHQIDDDVIKAWYTAQINAYKALYQDSQQSPLPQIALARHTMGWQVVVVNLPTQTLQNTIKTHQSNGQILKAERLALQAIMSYVSLLDSLYEQTARQTYRASAEEWGILRDDEGNPQPALFAFAPFSSASEIAPIHALTHSGNLLMQWLLGTSARLPLNPFDDTLWQSRHAPYLPEGVISVGLRYLLVALLHSPLEQRFTQEGAPSFMPLRETLREWERLLNQLSHFMDTESPEVLNNFNAHLPPVYRFTADSDIAKSIWLDLWWRVHLRDTLPYAKRNAQQTARNTTLSNVRQTMNTERDYRDTLRELLMTGKLTDAKLLTSALREDIGALARTKDIAQWAFWQHLGRWKSLLDSTAPSDLIGAVGFALHIPPREDTRETLDTVEGWLKQFSPTREDILLEVRLRQTACALRRSQPFSWQARLNALQSDVARVYFSDTAHYLRLPSPMQEDISLRPHTLVGDMIGQASELMKQLQEAIAVKNFALAIALIEFAQVLPEHHTEIQSEIATYADMIAFLQSGDKFPVAYRVNQAIRFLQLPLVSDMPALRDTLETYILSLSESAFTQVQTALERKTWEALKQAYPAYRLMTERQTRHPIEQLRVTRQESPRTILITATLNAYERHYKLYQTLYTTAQQHALGRIISPDTPTIDSKTLFALLQEAIELGLPMSDFIQADDSLRQEWQKMVQDALTALSRVEGFTAEISTLRQLIEGETGMKNQLTALMAEIASLHTQIDGNGDTPSLTAQVRTLRTKLDELETTYQGQLEQQLRNVKTLQEEVRRQVEAHDIMLQRQTNQITGNGNLIDDARERLALLEHTLKHVQAHESALLLTYLEAMPQATTLLSMDAVLDSVDGMVHALRRCPLEAYTEACHQAWIGLFNTHQDQLNTLQSKLNWREKRKFKSHQTHILQLMTTCKEEAIAKQAAYQAMITRSENTDKR